ncbi:MAG: GIY-YIG nuclease family protein [Cytophagales bacterium]|nr:GIY-YIG nuclease family protein [Cytophagales bacterium]
MYILYSAKLERYYVGSTNNLEDRLRRHNKGYGKYTQKGIPWILVSDYRFSTRSEAVKFENRIKKRGIKRFLLDSNHGV